ncbi:MAG: class I SAM-dependent methyltransferase [Pseudomonadota bacterium]
MSTDRDWEEWGSADPYFGVCSDDTYRRSNLTSQAREQFFRSGEAHIRNVIARLHEHFDSTFTPHSALDFGCGVGRLTIPLAMRANQVLGIDISRSMIEEAVRNCDEAGIDNVSFAISDDALSAAPWKFDIVHTNIVLQHIPWRRGRRIIQQLADRVEKNGYLCAQVLTRCSSPVLIRRLVKLRYAIPALNWTRNLLRRRPAFEPAMQLHVYDLKSIISDLGLRGFMPILLIVSPPIPTFEFESTLLISRRISANDSLEPFSACMRFDPVCGLYGTRHRP